MVKQLWGRIPVELAVAAVYFNKGGAVQNLIHELKYRDRPMIAEFMGSYYGRTLRNNPDFKDINLIIPVPLHYSRKRQRGYNQSDHFAQGLGATLGIPVSLTSLKRIHRSGTQTKKSRISRYESLLHSFRVNNPESLAGKHILLADDVFTTGATIEACALALQDIRGIRISVVTIAFTL